MYLGYILNICIYVLNYLKEIGLGFMVYKVYPNIFYFLFSFEFIRVFCIALLVCFNLETFSAVSQAGRQSSVWNIY